PAAGAMWFGLLFMAGITSSLAMGQPILAFFEDEYRMSRIRAAVLFGGATFALGFLCVWLYPGGAFDEFDFWTGTFSLVVFGLLEVIAFGWIFGMERGWAEITRGADIAVPRFFRFVIRYVTPLFILVVFVGAFIQPTGGHWGAALWSLFQGEGWPFGPDSVMGRLFHVGSAEGWLDANGRVTRTAIQDGTRTVLLLVFLGIAWLVHLAWRRKAREAA
ncbi:MAG: sodium:calcium symporter, partial [Gemmatimonadota bacterium]|nr:sodium:calcium symporter [Gemmatimonadota bacterium]